MQQPQVPIDPATAIQNRSIARLKGDHPLFHCLIVSPECARRELFSRAACEDGWEIIACDDFDSAIDYSRKVFIQLAMVDLENDSSGDAPRLLEHLSHCTGLLTIICGHEDDPEEEIFVRQYGVWLYLPGTAEISDISLLCGEARHIVERLHAAAQVPVKRKVIGKSR